MTKTLQWGKQTSQNFKDIILECAENTDGIDPHDNLFLFDARDPEAVKQFHDTLPTTVQNTMHMYTLGRSDLSFPINIKFDRDCLNKDQGVLMFHLEFSSSEKKAVEQTIKEICDMVGAEYEGMTEKDEYLVRNEDFDTLSELLVAVVSTRLGGVRMKYIAPYARKENTYRLRFAKGPEDDPIYSRYLFISSSSSFHCPKCGDENIQSIDSEKEDEKTFCCLSCGIAVTVDYISISYELEPDTPSREIVEMCERKLKKTYSKKDNIDIQSGLKLIGETDSVTLYEDVDVYPHSGKTTELWIHKENSPVVVYDIDQLEFLDKYEQDSESVCEICNEKRDTDRVWGAYYAEGAGIHEKTLNVCSRCQSELIDNVRKILEGADEASEYISGVL